MEDSRNITISLATAKEWYNGDNSVLKELALQAFNKKELQPVTCVKSWEEFCEQYIISENEYYIDTYSDINNVDTNNVKYSICRDHIEDRNLLATKEDAESFLALMQLKRLRDQWWEALVWKPDYTDSSSYKYIIQLIRNEITIDYIHTINRFLVFPTREIAEKFLNCFKDLINKAKELI
jgi:hypothetical protein